MKILFMAIAVCLVIRIVHAQESKNPIGIDVGTAFTHNNLDWSIAGSLAGNNPNILSEVKWKSLKGTAVAVGLEIPLLKSFYLKGSWSKSFTYKGAATDTDYAEDNRTNPVYKAELNSESGYLSNYQLKAGYHLTIAGLKLSLNLGYSIQQQHLHLTDDGFTELNSTYKTRWNGLSAGATFYKSIYKFNLITTMDYHQLNYYAEADWNLIDEFKHPLSFKHIAKGFGVTIDVKLLYKMLKPISPYINFGMGYFSTGAGIDELYYTDGRTAKTRLNDVSRNGYNLGFGLKITI
ncbi:MAG TPA: hypothetical protein VFM79_08640 [Pelobium sp.]|nr:hypothetical protein [Pelobium sp.]